MPESAFVVLTDDAPLKRGGVVLSFFKASLGPYTRVVSFDDRTNFEWIISSGARFRLLTFSDDPFGWQADLTEPHNRIWANVNSANRADVVREVLALDNAYRGRSREVQEHLASQRKRQAKERLFAYVRKEYRVPARLGGRVKYDAWPVREGAIIDIEVDNIWVRFDGELVPTLFHPADRALVYLDAQPLIQRVKS